MKPPSIWTGSPRLITCLLRWKNFESHPETAFPSGGSGMQRTSPVPDAAPGGRVLLELEIDVHGIAAAGGEPGGGRIDLRHPLGGREHGLVHQRIPARLHDLRAGNLPVFFNPDFHRADKRFGLVEDRRRLVPLAVEPVVNELVIPGELRRIAARSGFCGRAGSLRRRARPLRLSGGLGIGGFCRSSRSAGTF